MLRPFRLLTIDNVAEPAPALACTRHTTDEDMRRQGPQKASAHQLPAASTCEGTQVWSFQPGHHTASSHGSHALGSTELPHVVCLELTSTTSVPPFWILFVK